jgi:hypothetical protein
MTYRRKTNPVRWGKAMSTVRGLRVCPVADEAHKYSALQSVAVRR